MDYNEFHDNNLHNLIYPGEIFYSKKLKAYWICTNMIKNFYRGLLSKADIESSEIINRPELSDDINSNFKIIINDIEFDITRQFSIPQDEFFKSDYEKEEPASDSDITKLFAKLIDLGFR